MTKRKKRACKLKVKGRLQFRLIILGFAILSFLFIGLPYFLSQRDRPDGEGREGLVPSEVLSHKADYNRQALVIRGKVSSEPVVCERENCPDSDPCCGCPNERDLLIADPGLVLTSKTKGRLKLVDYQRGSMCRRLPESCDYSCQDWVEGAVYDVEGMFFAEPPPSGWRLSLEQYFEVEDKRLVRKVGLQEVLGNVLGEVMELFGQLGRPSSFVLQ